LSRSLRKTASSLATTSDDRAAAVNEIEALATSTDLSIRQIQAKIGGRASRGIVGEITKRARALQPAPL